MGKSDKKVKSDRINSLRKKYDAFLEEDKKRKERNEYILEKLDKMRYCNAVVPVRQKTNVLTEPRPAALHNVPRQFVEKSMSMPFNDHHFGQLESPRKNVDETILQEISKKYILIPKLKSTNDDYVIIDGKPKIDDNTDWKSKYQILEQLKRDEKEPNSPSQEIFQARHEDQPNNTHETPNKDEDILLQYRKEIPDHILSENKLSYDLQTYPNDNDEIEQIYYDNKINENTQVSNNNELLESYKDVGKNTEITGNLENTAIESFKNYESHDVKDVYGETNVHQEFDQNYENYKCVEENLIEGKINAEFDNAIKVKEDTPKEPYPNKGSSENYIAQEQVATKSDSKQPEVPEVNDGNQEDENTQEVYLAKEEVTLVHDMNASDVVNVMNNDISPNASTEYPIETIDVQDFTPHEDVQLEDGVNINPESQVMVGQEDLTYHYDPIVDTEHSTDPTNQFEIEQSQEIYDEQANQNYDYTEEGLQDNYNTEHTAPTENYEQTEYAYYEGAQTEQAYQEVAENEDPQRYDQTYEQQYGGTYDQEAYPQQGYEQEYVQQGSEQPEYTEQMQHYEATAQTQHGSETVQYENQDELTPQYVEQQLDNEQGYAEKQDENIEIGNVEKVKNSSDKVTAQ